LTGLAQLPDRFEVCYEASCGYGFYHDVSGAGGPGQFGRAGRAVLPASGGSIIGRLAPDWSEDGGPVSVDLRWG